jgi:ApaG protein
MIYNCKTAGISVTVRPRFERLVAIDQKIQHVFSYEVTIENNSDVTVQLLSRKWIIIDGNKTKKIIEGDGVVGQQPVLEPGQSHTYNSWCPMITPVGKMYGYFKMINTSKKTFKAIVPEFLFHTPYILN